MATTNETQVLLEEICRLCLSNKAKGSIKIFSAITETQRNKFEDLTQTNLPYTENYPRNICSDCSDQLESFHFYKNQLIRKQKELIQFLKIDQLPTLNEDDHDDNYEIVEEPDEIEYSEELYFDEQNDFPEMSQDAEYLDEMSDGIEHESDFDSETLPKAEAAIPELVVREEVKYKKVKPTLVLTPDFLKAREALKAQPNKPEKLPDNSEYVAATLVSDSNEKLVYICSYRQCKCEFATLEEMNLHLVDHKFDSGLLQCYQCPMSFKTRHNYDKHVKTAHGNYQYVCQVCGQIFSTRIQWRSHIRNHDTTLKFKCPYEGCEKAFRVKHHLNNHLRVHTKNSPFVCTFEKCEARFRQKHALTIHLRKHTGEFISCEVCKSPFVTQFQLNKHQAKCDGTFKPLVTRSIRNRGASEAGEQFKCSVEDCFEEFKMKSSLEKHLTKIHRIEVTPTMCIQCCREFETPRELKAHLREHLPFTCTLCGCGFKSEETFKAHSANTHDKEEVRLHHCKECSASFKRADHLRTHIAYKHSKERPFACDSCSYLSPTRKDLNVHMKIHLKGNSFACQLCDFKASKQNILDSHVRTLHKTIDNYFAV